MKNYLLLFFLCVAVFANAQNVGINNMDPQAALDLKGDLRLRTANLKLQAAINHNVILDEYGNGVVYHFIGDAVANGGAITGFQAYKDGQIITIFNNCTSEDIILHDAGNTLSLGSDKKYRILTGTGQSANIKLNGSITLRYDGEKERWIVLNSHYVNGLTATPWLINGNNISNSNTANVGIGLSAPSEKLQIINGNIKIGENGWGSAADNRLLKFGDGSFVTIGEVGGDDKMEIKANDITLQTTITKIPNGNLGIGTGANSIQNRLQIGNPTGFVNNDIAIGNGTQAMSLYQSPTASTFHTNTNFAFMPASGTGNLGIGTDTPTQKLQVLGNIALGNEMYSTATAGLNIVPIGVIKINEIGDNNHNGYYFTPFYTNEVGNLGYGGVRIITSGADDGRIFNIHLNPAITNNYVKVIVIGGAGFNNSNASAAIYSAKAEIVPSEPLGNPAGSGGLSLKIFYYGDNLNYMTPNGTFLIYGIK